MPLLPAAGADAGCDAETVARLIREPLALPDMGPGFHDGRTSVARRAFGEHEDEELERLSDLPRRGREANLHRPLLKNQGILLELVELEDLDELEADRAPVEVEAPRLTDQLGLRGGERLIGRRGVVRRQEGDAGLRGLLQHRV